MNNKTPIINHQLYLNTKNRITSAGRTSMKIVLSYQFLGQILTIFQNSMGIDYLLYCKYSKTTPKILQVRILLIKMRNKII